MTQLSALSRIIQKCTNYSKDVARCLYFLLLILLISAPIIAKPVSHADAFSYEELITLYEKEPLPHDIENKLDTLLTTPFVNNTLQKSPLNFLKSPGIGDFLRIVQWNIERGLEYEAIEASFTDEARFEALLDKEKYPIGSSERHKLLEQASMLRTADVIVLNEVDWGMKRSGYRNVAAELAAKLKMNYAFGVQFVELSPIHFSRIQPGSDAGENKILDLAKVDPALYKGLHGIAILSRMPLKNVRLVPFESQPYDWYKSEKDGISLLEKGKREISKKVFLEKTLREVRRGGRTMLFADIVDSRIPQGSATIAATHLENRTSPANRVKELKELLGQIKNINHPVIVAGDMNTSTEDLTPTTFRRELTKRFGNPKFWVNMGLSYALGFGFIEQFALSTVALGRKHADPTVRNIPFLAPNHEKIFFTTLKDFRFDDGGSFDFRGDSTRSSGKTDLLSNSNERTGKGFVTTYQVNRPIMFIGKYKLDWIFVKPANLSNPKDKQSPYRFAPHFGRTLNLINEIGEDRISDHRPILVDLPLDEPVVEKFQ